ncbi:MAG: disulfide bond formation protein B [Hyphomicrobiales bacterium]
MTCPFPVGRFQLYSAFAFLGFAFVCLLLAWGFQYIGGFTPCRLCLEQREPYYTTIPIIALNVSLISVPLLQKGSHCLARGLFLIAGLFMVYGAVTGVYQAGAEWGLWAGPADCTGDAAGGATGVGDLMAQLKTAKVVRCDIAQIRILGLSFAGWNVLSSGFLAAIAFAAGLLPAWPSFLER